MLPQKNIDEPNVNNRVSSYPKATLKLPLGTLTHAYTYIRKLGSRCIRVATGNLEAPYGGLWAQVYINVTPYKFIIKF